MSKKKIKNPLGIKSKFMCARGASGNKHSINFCRLGFRSGAMKTYRLNELGFSIIGIRK